MYDRMVGAGTYVFRLDSKDYGSACVGGALAAASLPFE